MKKRLCFISNSSSSSFVVDFKFMNPPMIDKIKDLARRHNDDSGEGHLKIGKNFIFGRINQNDESGLLKYVKENVNNNYWEVGD